jgi:hypothetical protein
MAAFCTSSLRIWGVHPVSASANLTTIERTNYALASTWFSGFKSGEENKREQGTEKGLFFMKDGERTSSPPRVQP